jgi:predicted phage terminase large subunit-like protein
MSEKKQRQILNSLFREQLFYFIRKSFQENNPGEAFLDNWHLRAMAYQLEQCVIGETKRLIITLPPRHLKSHCATIALPAWILGRDPTAKIITASYAQPLADEHTRLFREIIQSEWYARLFPRMIIQSGHNRSNEQVTSLNGYRKATSVGGSITGMGGNFLILDDVIKPEDALSEVIRTRVNDWYSNTLISRLNNPSEDVIIAVMQRTHVDDFIGHITQLGEWTVLNIPATATERTEYQIGRNPGAIYVRETGELIDPRRQTADILAEIREGMGERNYLAQYQQQPLPDDGGLIKRHWFRSYSDEELPDDFDRIIISWDTATGENEQTDYSVATIWGIKGYQFYLLHVHRARMEYPELLNKAFDLVEEFDVDTVLVEMASTGTPLLQRMRRDLGVRARGMRPKRDKYARMSLQAPFIERGQVYLPNEASWLADFLSEVLAFPGSSFFDQVDSMEQFLRYAEGINLTRPYPHSNRRDNPGGSGRHRQRRNIRRHPGTHIPGISAPGRDEEPYQPSLVLGGV